MHQLEKNIINSIRKGDEKAFETLFRSYFGQLFNYAKEILKDHDLAEEMAEEAFVKLWENRQSLHIETSVRSYLFRTVYNQCINHFKHEKVKDKYRLFFQHHIHPEHYNASYAMDFPLANILNKEIESLIDRSINNLPAQCREIFMMSRYEDMRNEKIAETLGVSVSTVKTQISRALVKLRKDLQEVLPLL